MIRRLRDSHVRSPIIAYFEEDAQEINNNGLQSHSDDEDRHEGHVCDQAREKIILVINTTRTYLIEDLEDDKKTLPNITQ